MIETAAGRALLCHGLGPNDLAKVGPDDEGYAIEANDDLQSLLRGEYRFVLNGHSHRRMVRHFGGTTLINAGRLRGDHQPGFVLLDFEAGFAELLRFDAARRIEREGRLALSGEPAPPHRGGPARSAGGGRPSPLMALLERGI